MRAGWSAVARLAALLLALAVGASAQDPDRDLPPQRVQLGPDACIEHGLELLAAGWSWRAAATFREATTQQPDRPLGHLLLALAVRDAPNHAARRCWDAVSRLPGAADAERRLVEAYQRYFGVDTQPELKDRRFQAPPPDERAERLAADLAAIAGLDTAPDVPDRQPRRSVAARLHDLERARLAAPAALPRAAARRALDEQNAWLNASGEMPFVVAGHTALLAQALDDDPERDVWLARVPRHPRLGSGAAPAMPLPGMRAMPPAARWEPRAAPGFDLPRGLGGRGAYADHADRPLLVVFFLGFG